VRVLHGDASGLLDVPRNHVAEEIALADAAFGEDRDVLPARAGKKRRRPSCRRSPSFPLRLSALIWNPASWPPVSRPVTIHPARIASPPPSPKAGRQPWSRATRTSSAWGLPSKSCGLRLQVLCSGARRLAPPWRGVPALPEAQARRLSLRTLIGRAKNRKIKRPLCAAGVERHRGVTHDQRTRPFLIRFCCFQRWIVCSTSL